VSRFITLRVLLANQKTLLSTHWNQVFVPLQTRKMCLIKKLHCPIVDRLVGSLRSNTFIVSFANMYNVSFQTCTCVFAYRHMHLCKHAHYVFTDLHMCLCTHLQCVFTDLHMCLCLQVHASLQTCTLRLYRLAHVSLHTCAMCLFKRKLCVFACRYIVFHGVCSLWVAESIT
jgi:hypothetical protein